MDKEKKTKEAQPPIPKSDLDRMAGMMGQMGISSKDQMALYLAEQFKKAGLSEPSDTTVDKFFKRIEDSPISMPLTEVAADEALSKELKESGTVAKIADVQRRVMAEMLPYMYGFKMMDMMAGSMGFSSGRRSDLEDKIMDAAVKNMLGEETGKFSELTSELRGLRSDVTERKAGGESILSTMIRAADELKSGMNAFEKSADAMGYTRESKSDMEKAKDFIESAKGLLDSVRGRKTSKPPRRERGELPVSKKKEKPIPIEAEEEGTEGKGD